MELERTLLEKMIDILGLEGIDPETFDYDTNLFPDGSSEGLGMDSVDALEIVVMLKNDFGVIITDEDNKKMIFKSVRSIADFVSAKTREAAG